MVDEDCEYYGGKKDDKCLISREQCNSDNYCACVIWCVAKEEKESVSGLGEIVDG